MIESKPFEVIDFAHFPVRQYELDTVGRERLLNLANESIAAVYSIHHVPLAVIGFRPMWPKVVEGFIIPSVHIPAYGLVFVRFVQRLLTNTMEAIDAHRLQTVSLAEPETDKWMETIGFTLEGTLARYTPDGVDYRMWARYR